MMNLDVHLHSTHWMADSWTPQPLRWDRAPSTRTERLRVLDTEARASLADCGNVKDADHEVVFKSRSILLRSRGAKDLYVPMLLSEVGYSVSEETSIIALAHPAELGSYDNGPGTEDAFDVWLLVAPGGSDSLHSLLGMLSKRGAVRGDIEGNLEIPEKPFSFGGHSRLYMVKSLHAGIVEESLTLAAKVVPAGNPKQLAQADTEAELLFQAQGHPNVIRVRGIFCADLPMTEDNDEGDVDGKPDKKKNWPIAKQILLMDLCKKGSLHSHVQRHGPLAEVAALDLTGELFSALVHIHGRGIVHRDVKADNVLCGSEGQPILTDFGIAAFLSDDCAMQQRAGTPGYAAPELFSTGPYNEKVDVFSMGVLLYYCVCARHPFSSPTRDVRDTIRRTMENEVEFPAQSVISQQMRQLILMLLAKPPDDRPNATASNRIVSLLTLAAADSRPAPLEADPPQPGSDTPRTVPIRPPSPTQDRRLWSKESPDAPNQPTTSTWGFLRGRKDAVDKKTKYQGESPGPSEHYFDDIQCSHQVVAVPAATSPNRLVPSWLRRRNAAARGQAATRAPAAWALVKTQSEGQPERSHSKASSASATTKASVSPSRMANFVRRTRTDTNQDRNVSKASSSASSSAGWATGWLRVGKARSDPQEAHRSSSSAAASSTGSSRLRATSWSPRRRRVSPVRLLERQDAQDSSASGRGGEGSDAGTNSNSLPLGWFTRFRPVPRPSLAAPAVPSIRVQSNGQEAVEAPTLSNGDFGGGASPGASSGVSSGSTSAGWLPWRSKASPRRVRKEPDSQDTAAPRIPVNSGPLEALQSGDDGGFSPSWSPQRVKTSPANLVSPDATISGTHSIGDASDGVQSPDGSRSIMSSLSPQRWLRGKTPPATHASGDGQGIRTAASGVGAGAGVLNLTF